MMNLAHRGASTYAPENTMAAFYLGLAMGATGLETDVKRTRDGKLVLFHDDTTKRISAVDLNINESDYADLFAIDLGSYRGAQYKGERIVLAEDFFRAFGARDIDLAIELKDTGVEADTLALIRKYVPDDSRLCVTSFHFNNLALCRKLDKDIALGFLTDNCLDDTLDKAADIGCAQICPHVNTLTKENVAHAKARGFVVRSWGNDTPYRMMQSFSFGVDGMTVNFPDILAKVLAVSIPEAQASKV
jgi:glycerophosphoryl diester phosphodiesterase